MSFVIYESVVPVPKSGATAIEIAAKVAGAERRLQSVLPEAWGLQRFVVRHIVHPQEGELLVRFVLEPSSQLTFALSSARGRKQQRGIAEAEQELKIVRAAIIARQVELDSLAPSLRREAEACIAPDSIDDRMAKLLRQAGAVHTFFPNDSPQSLCIPRFERQVLDPQRTTFLVVVASVSPTVASTSLPRMVVHGETKRIPRRKFTLMPAAGRFPLDVLQTLSAAMANQQDVALECQPLRDAITNEVIGARLVAALDCRPASARAKN